MCRMPELNLHGPDVYDERLNKSGEKLNDFDG